MRLREPSRGIAPEIEAERLVISRSLSFPDLVPQLLAVPEEGFTDPDLRRLRSEVARLHECGAESDWMSLHDWLVSIGTKDLAQALDEVQSWWKSRQQELMTRDALRAGMLCALRRGEED